MTSDLRHLQDAIAGGNISEATRLTTLLCQKNSSLVIHPFFDASTLGIRVSVVFEDKKKMYGHIMMKLNPTVPVRELKNKVYELHKIPPELQRWFIKNHLATDDDTLSGCGITEEAADAVIYIYIVSARLSGLTADEILSKYYSGASPAAKTETRKTEVKVVGEGEGCRTQATPMHSFSAEANMDTSPAVPPAGIKAPLPTPAPRPKRTPEPPKNGWECPRCTFINVPTRPGCQICSEGRPENYVVPANVEITQAERERMNQEAILDLLTERQRLQDERDHEEERQRNLQALLATDDAPVVLNTQEFECPICYTEYEAGEGVVLRECLHPVCRDCLAGHVEHSEDMPVSCPYRETDNPCEGIVQHREVQQVVTPEIFQRYLARSLQKGVAKLTNTYQCKTPDCAGIYELVDDINQFTCQVCKHKNCVACNAIHDDMNCQEYQDDLKRKEDNDEAARQTKAALEAMVRNGEAMNCPKCGVIVQKRSGCDWMKCSMCATEICWATKGPRWGPGGRGDTSGGCGCRIGVKPCTPNCGNCH